MGSNFRISKSDKRELQKISKRGSTPTRVSNRCKILLALHKGYSVDETAERIDVGTATVKRVRRHYQDVGLERAIYDAPKSGRPKKLSSKEDIELIALACTSPLDGRSRRSIRLLASKSKNSYGLVHKTLKADGMKPWREKNVVHTNDYS